MKTKTFEIRDEGTHIPAMAIVFEGSSEKERYQLARAGFGVNESHQDDYALLIHLTSMRVNYDPSKWGGGRTMQIAHTHIIQNWSSLESGQVIDVQFILGETEEPKESEAIKEYSLIIDGD